MRIILAAAILLMFGLAEAAGLRVVNLAGLTAGTTLSIAVPEGFCEVRKDGSPSEQSNYASVSNGVPAGRAMLAAYMIDCASHARLGTANPMPAAASLMVVIPFKDGAPHRLPGVSRAEFLNFVEREPRPIPRTAADLEALAQRLRMFDAGVVQTEDLGHLARDDYAVYNGQAHKQDWNGEMVNVMSITASTVVREHMLGVNLVRRYRNAQDVAALVAEAQRITGVFLRWNDPSVVATRP